jgi:predicted nucleotidyltransferase
MRQSLKTVLAQLHAGLEALYGPRLVHTILYGSQARGEAAPDSDIDVLVVLQGPVDPGVEISHAGHLTASLSLQYNVVISCAFVAEDRFRSERSPFLLNVHREGVPV